MGSAIFVSVHGTTGVSPELPSLGRGRDTAPPKPQLSPPHGPMKTDKANGWLKGELRPPKQT
jgi:hypothetical protein